MPRKLTVSDVLSISKDKRPAKVIAAEIQVGERQVRRIRTGIQHKGITGTVSYTHLTLPTILLV